MDSNETVRILLTSGLLSLNAKSEDGNTPLHNALLQKNLPFAQLLVKFLQQNPNTTAINAKNNQGDTPLHIAARLFPQQKIVLDLVDAGAKLGIPNKADEVVDFPRASCDVAAEEESYVKRIDKELEGKSEEAEEDYPGWLTIESMSDFSPKNDLLMPF